jgi:hypothetical protein
MWWEKLATLDFRLSRLFRRPDLSFLAQEPHIDLVAVHPVEFASTIGKTNRREQKKELLDGQAFN